MTRRPISHITNSLQKQINCHTETELNTAMLRSKAPSLCTNGSRMTPLMIPCRYQTSFFLTNHSESYRVHTAGAERASPNRHFRHIGESHKQVGFQPFFSPPLLFGMQLVHRKRISQGPVSFYLRMLARPVVFCCKTMCWGSKDK
jgi:hypothetical protein